MLNKMMRFVGVRAFGGIGMILAILLADRAIADDAKKVQAHLEAGEFGPARTIAERSTNRDSILSNIAAFQAKSGMRRAAIDTAADIRDDRSRSRSLSQIGETPIVPAGGRGGGAQADFDSLIELVTSTVAPDSWDEVGGNGAIKEFAGGVAVDTSGVIRRLKIKHADWMLDSIRKAASRRSANDNVHKRSDLRKISLTRLEKELQLRWAMGQSPTETMKCLAGLQNIKYVLVYPKEGEIVIAGKAGDWHTNVTGRKVNSETGRPVLQLDDFVVVLRNAYNGDGNFGCSINPTRAGLLRYQEFAKKNTNPIRSKRQRTEWLANLKKALGKQQIGVYGIDPRTRTAHVLVEADYHMKLVGMGLEEGTLGVKSFFDNAARSGHRPNNVIRWWFTLNYKSVEATRARNAFAFKGKGVKVLSENEFLTERGERVHTGKSDLPTQQFAEGFTKQFEALAQKYPVYAELKNVFDLALVAGLIRSEDLAGQVGWHMTHFRAPQGYEVELGDAPKQVDTILNHRVIGKRVVAAVSGGVTVNTRSLVNRKAISVDDYGLLQAEHSGGLPKDLPRDVWWWD